MSIISLNLGIFKFQYDNTLSLKLHLYFSSYNLFKFQYDNTLSILIYIEITFQKKYLNSNMIIL